MNKKELVAAMQAKTGIAKKDAEAAVAAFIEVVEEAVAKKDFVRLIGFGTFVAKDRAARKAKNPQSGKVIEIPATTVPAFKPGKAFKAMTKPVEKAEKAGKRGRPKKA